MTCCHNLQSPAAYESTETDAKRLAEEIGAEYWPTSSKTGKKQLTVCGI